MVYESKSDNFKVGDTVGSFWRGNIASKKKDELKRQIQHSRVGYYYWQTGYFGFGREYFLIGEGTITAISGQAGASLGIVGRY
jgi:hypothetical protein